MCGSQRTIASEKRDVLEKLLAAWKSWDGELAKPLWGGRAQRAAQPAKKKRR